MPSVLALRALLGAGLGLGALDVVWIDAALAPEPVVIRPAPPVVVPIETPAPPPPPPPETIVDHVYFATGSATVTPRARKVLAELATVAGPTAQLVLDGHADYRGTEALNKTLSRDRALAVQDQLVQLGIDRTRIHVGYAGEGGHSAELWRDRRVDIQITGGPR